LGDKIKMENDGPHSMIEEDLDARSDPEKTAIECICPKCGERHIVNFHWIGRGTPRKFCPLCKNTL
jgi:hypothetical protein